MHMIVDRYLQGTLQGDEKAEFEERLLWDEALMDEVDLADRLREGLRASAKQPAREIESPGIVDWLRNLVYVPQYAAAASFVVAVALTATLFVSPVMNVEQPRDINTAQTEIIPLFSTRSDDVQIVRVDQDGWAVLLINETGSHESYRVTISSDKGDAEPIWARDDLTATYLDSLAVTMPGSAFTLSDYLLTLEGVLIDDSGNRSYEHLLHIPFRVAPAD